jgi:alpha-mannosidase
MTPPLRQIHVVPHTHWDREWYHTAERFRQRLVRLIDELLDDPPAGGASFLLDGQTILLDDYLSVRPERAAELSSLLRDGYVEAGPWYVLADNLIPSGEALVRNLLAGKEALGRMRAPWPNVLYCPDSFGHPAILPELAAGFGLDLILLWRGFGGARWPSADVVRWRGPSGATAVVYHLPPDGYEFGSSLPVKQSDAYVRWLHICDVLCARANTGVAMLLNGADHHARQRDLDVALSALATAAAPVVITATSLASAARSVVSASTETEIPAIAGELRDSYGYTWTLQGTFATRAAQKRRNALAERALVRDVEPWVALSGDAGARALLRATWRTLLHAHPHDTLCGTSIDAVAGAFDARLASVETQIDELRKWATSALMGHDAEQARTSPSEWKPAVMVRNAVARPRGGVVELHLSATLADVAVGPGSAARQGARRRVPPWRVNGMALQLLARGERVDLTESPRAYPDADLVAEATAVGWMEPVGGYALSTRLHGNGAATRMPNPVVASTLTLDNGRIRIVVNESGAVSLHDLERDRTIDDVITFERNRDVGDLYTPAIRDPLPAPVVRRMRVLHRGPIRGEIAIDYRMPGSRSTYRIGIQLDADSRAMKIVVSGDNRDRDHRLRLRIATGLTSAATVADAAFFPVTRAPLDISAEDAAMEQVVRTAPLHRWVARFSEDDGAVVISDGLAEYESLDDGSVAITLVRSVGALSRADLPERPGHAGWPRPTPVAQSIGRFDARFALQLVGPDSDDVRMEIERAVEDTLTPLVGETVRSNLLNEHSAGGIELRGDGLTFSAAMPAQRDDWLVLRCVNQCDERVEGAWRLAFDVDEAQRARLDEVVLSALDVEDNVVGFWAEPREIVTILVRPAPVVIPQERSRDQRKGQPTAHPPAGPATRRRG